MSKKTRIATILIISIICLCLFISTAAAATTGLWTYGGEKYDDAVNNLATMDGSHIIVGTTENYGSVGYDMWIYKVAGDGSMTWSRHYGGDGNESGYNVIATTDGGYAIVGVTSSYGESEANLWLVKVDSEGYMQWNKTYEGAYIEEGWMLLQTSDGGYLITGLTSNAEDICDGLLLKTDSAGNLQWQKTYGGSGDDAFYGITATTDGGYILTGLTNSTGAGEYDVWLVKVDSSGTEQWAKTYGGPEDDIGYIAFESETDFVVDCITYSYGAGGGDIWLLKVDAMGGLMWNYTYGGAENDNGWYGAKTTDGGYALGGFTYSYGSGENAAAWLVKVDKNGMTMWNRTYGVADRDYYTWAVTETSDGGYALSGETSPVDSDNSDASDAFLIITDSNGNAAIENTSNMGLLYAVGAIIVVLLVVAIVAVVVLMRRKPKQPQPPAQ
jgi:hypothetical protein